MQVLRQRSMPLVATALINEHPGIREGVGLNATKLLKFLTYIDSLYSDVPYHNSMHALQVLWATHSLLHSSNLICLLPPLYVVAIMVAAACHDVGHKCAAFAPVYRITI